MEAFGQDYMMSLEELTFNSRPLITTLTTIAQENIQAAEVITRVIEEHIIKCAPASKLPALYLLDSICKNVGSPYTLLFGRNLYRTFADAYTLVNDDIRKKMHELFQTWKMPLPATGQSLFSNEPLRKIESFLNKAHSTIMQIQHQDRGRYSPSYGNSKPTPSQQQAHLHNPATPVTGVVSNGASGEAREYVDRSTPAVSIPVITPVRIPYTAPKPVPVVSNAFSTLLATKEGLLSEISTLIQLTNEKLAENPSDADGNKQLSALVQLHSILLPSQFPPAQLSTIKSKLDALSLDLQRYHNKRKADVQDLGQVPAKRPWVQDTGRQPWSASTSQSFYGQPLNPSNLTPELLASVVQSLSQPKPAQPPMFAMPRVPQAVPVPGDSSALFASLLSANLISAQPTGGSEVTGAFSKLMIAEVEVSNLFIQRPHPNLVGLLYDSLPLKCSTCGRRFADTPRERSFRDAHLDWHYRVN
ncbi:hypothetical protein V1512DRAFT_293435, partial [Lipomyces arxii]|uniref:uncharacterized protein n=1 Tax=Lipomyces arxii TaxID=56418 RepID=UPI0034CDC127